MLGKFCARNKNIKHHIKEPIIQNYGSDIYGRKQVMQIRRDEQLFSDPLLYKISVKTYVSEPFLTIKNIKIIAMLVLQVSVC